MRESEGKTDEFQEFVISRRDRCSTVYLYVFIICTKGLSLQYLFGLAF